MKTIGLIGGMSWESSAEYYRLINETVEKRLGSLHSAKIIMYSINFEELEKLQREGKWGEATNLIINVTKKLEMAGADFILICSVTGHEGAEKIEVNINVPLLHIADVTAEEIISMGLEKIGLLGTKYTMEKEFYKSCLVNKFGLEVIIPNESERETIHSIIYNELCAGKIKESSKEQFKNIIENLVGKGAEGIILGCTEIPLLIKQEDCDIPLFDTTALHAKAAVDYALRDYSVSLKRVI